MSSPYPPYDPYGSTPPPPGGPHISQYAAPRTPRFTLVIVALVVLVGVIVAGLVLTGRPEEPAATGSPSAKPSAAVSDDAGLPFTMPLDANAGGVWSVLDQEWTATGVDLRIRVTATSGRISYGFVAFPNSGAESVQPVAGPREPALTSGVLRAGDSAEGYVFFPLERGSATLILTTSAGRQISALPITG